MKKINIFTKYVMGSPTHKVNAMADNDQGTYMKKLFILIKRRLTK